MKGMGYTLITIGKNTKIDIAKNYFLTNICQLRIKNNK